MKLSEIKSNPNNPRVIKDHKFEKLKKSISEFPKMMELRPMVINEDNIVLGGNMRLKALKDLGYKEVPEEWVKRASDLTEEETRRFIIADNVGFGEHDWEMLANEWNIEELEDWGLDGFPFGVEDSEEFGTDFELPDGDKSPFQQMTFTLADEQAEQIKNAISDIKLTEEYKYCETMGNENSNGNALYLIIMQWAEQRK
jgi:hypothetical protein